MFVLGRFIFLTVDEGRLPLGIDGEAEGLCDMRSGSSLSSRWRLRDDECCCSERADMLTPAGEE
jgi:hypothetical protein